MAPRKYKLTYFPIKALGEPIRYLFAYGGIEYEDIRSEYSNWSQMKSKTPFGQLPMLEVDGKVVYQSISICRYLADQVGLAGADDLENLQIDSIIDTIIDFRLKVQDYNYDKDENSKAKKKEPLMKETIPFYVPKFEDVVKNNNGYLVNGKLTWADLYFVAILEYINGMVKKDIIEGSPNLIKLRKTVTEIPAIKAWIAKRPPSET